MLTEKEVQGIVIEDLDSDLGSNHRWVAIGKVCCPRQLNLAAFDRAMQKAWGLHGQAEFKEIGENRFVVCFNSKGGWKHAMNNSPWQFDFHVVLKEFDGSSQPSDMSFSIMAVWVL